MPIQTPICDFGQKAHDFELKSTENKILSLNDICLLYTSPSPRDYAASRMPSSA